MIACRNGWTETPRGMNERLNLEVVFFLTFSIFFFVPLLFAVARHEPPHVARPSVSRLLGIRRRRELCKIYRRRLRAVHYVEYNYLPRSAAGFYVRLHSRRMARADVNYKSLCGLEPPPLLYIFRPRLLTLEFATDRGVGSA